MIPSMMKSQILALSSMGMKQKEIAAITKCSLATVNKTLTNKKRVLVIGDAHCGHTSGLTPPKWQTRDCQSEVWEWYYHLVRTLNPDVLFVMGDMIDGKGKRSGRFYQNISIF